MGKPTGFIEFSRELPDRRPVGERVHDYLEVYNPFPDDKLKAQGARCMDCGIPFCHQGCPLGNNIPDWNTLVFRGDWEAASRALHATNNFPEFTGMLCPAPCESACVLAIDAEPVTIKNVELAIADRAWEAGYQTPRP
ncbi:MAG: glutamate synthase, partial [Isosphaeraceae bacterium]